MPDTIVRVTVWGENVHEHTNETVRSIYPDGMHETIAASLNQDPGIQARTATLQQPEHGLTEAVLDQTDVLTWWGHCAHGEVEDTIVERVHRRVLEGMGLIVLHSGHYAKIFTRLMGTSCSLKWREAGEKERLWICNPGHPIVQGIGGDYFELEQTEMYGEPFGIPTPDEQIFISWFEGGEVFRSGNIYRRGNGKVFYFRPGHETYPIYHHETVQLVLKNAVKWAAPAGSCWQDACTNVPADQAPEPLPKKGPRLHADGEEGYR
ncbi:MAG: ThuA domain-containing protein [Gammaproteobacteria bacterium]|nr:ThuA domain-containing protein [Gammaproteobacteria bacterium]